MLAPIDTVTAIDGGREYGKGFKDVLRSEEPRIKFLVNPPTNPNSAGIVENNHRVVRDVMRTYARRPSTHGSTGV